jgi:uroporphyrin-III C-methyltransferase / precorrin-2 dehydrogenase / sirohydrochlorin ferrochelatase
LEAINRITLSLTDYRGAALDGPWYALAAIIDVDVDAAVVAAAERRLIFCVRRDIAVEGAAVTPASFDYAGL